MVDERATLDAIDRKAVDYFLRHAIDTGRAEPEQRNDDTATVLENLHLTNADGLLTNAAILLFARDPQRFFPSAIFRIGRFGADEADLIYQDTIEGNILQMADKVVSVLRSKYLISPISYSGMQRIEKLEIPEDALRELLYNAIVHKWYGGAHTQMRVYDDHIELWNDGGLPENLTIETLKAKHASYPRNKLIASVFYRAGFIETWGRGIHKVCSAFREAGLEEPTFHDWQGGILVTIPRKLDEPNDTVDDTNDTVRDTNRDTLKETEKEMLRLLAENPYMTSAQLSAALCKSVPTIKRMTKKLCDANVIVRHGSNRGGYWQVLQGGAAAQKGGPQ